MLANDAARARSAADFAEIVVDGVWRSGSRATT